MILCLLVKDFASQLLPIPYTLDQLVELYQEIYHPDFINDKLKVELQRVVDIGTEAYIQRVQAVQEEFVIENKIFFIHPRKNKSHAKRPT